MRLVLCLLSCASCGGGSGGPGTQLPPADCPASTVIPGDLALASIADAARAACVTEVSGDLVVDASGLTTLDLAVLVRVAGGLRLESSSGLTRIALPRLEEVGGDLTVRDNGLLTTLDLGALTSVGGDFLVRGNRLATLDLPALAGTGHLHFHDLTGDALDLPQLSSVPGNFHVQESAVASIDVPLLGAVGEDLVVAFNRSLASLDGFAALGSVGRSLFIDSNRVLPTCEAEAFAARLAVGDQTMIMNNDDTAVCN
jgi:hypothetical protein